VRLRPRLLTLTGSEEGSDMGPCATCGQLTEPELDFCPSCAGYAAPATIYSYAPSRLNHSDAELEQILTPLAPPVPAPAEDKPASAPADEEWLTAPAEDDRLAGPVAAGARSPAANLTARLATSTAQRREGHWLVVSAMLIVLIIAAGTVLLEVGRPSAASPPPARAADSGGRPAPSPDVLPSPAGLPMSVESAAASSPHEAAVLAFLTSYFTAINNHDFAAYQRLFSPSLRADLSATTFNAGYGTTTDAAITLTDIAVIGSGELDAQVTFVSYQQPAASPTNSDCTSWSVSLYLLQQGGSDLLQQPPAGYQASYTACP